MIDLSDGKRDFFVSFNKNDRAWATWIAWALESAGYSVFFQDWDFKGNFVLEMDKAHRQSRRSIAVLSPDYLTSRFTAPEWAARFAQDANSEHDLLIPVRVRPCQLEGLLAQIVYVDLIGCSEAVARNKFLRRVEGIRLKPDEPSLFPGEVSHDAVPKRPEFPSAAPTSKTTSVMKPPPADAERRVPRAAWLIGTVVLATLVVGATVWMLVPKLFATMGSGIVNQGSGTQTFQAPVNIGGTSPPARDP